MVVNQFKRGTGGPRLGFASRARSHTKFGKVGECSGLSQLEKHPATFELVKITPTKFATPMRDGVIKDPVRVLPQKQV
jgi:hypothetical protein